MAKVPSYLIGATREALKALGLSKRIVKDDGSLDASALLNSVLREITISSNVLPDIVVHMPDPNSATTNTAPRADPATLADRLLREAAPTIRLKTIAGNVDIAPFGKATAGKGAATFSTIKKAAVGAGVLVGAIVLYKVVRRVRR